MEKQYGLIQSKKSTAQHSSRSQTFIQDSGSDSEDVPEWLKKSTKPSERSLQQRQAKLQMEKALAEDPTVYQYDEIYDQMEQEKKVAKEEKQDVTKKKPKYIQSLMQQAERRKREHERRVERQVQKDREAEGDEFKDKESFVTSAYKEKLEEMKRLDEEEKKLEHIEALTDVTKQKDISGFYRHLYRQSLGVEDKKALTKNESKEVDKNFNEDANPKNDILDKDQKSVDKKQRNYRKRKSSSELNITENLDADSDLDSSEESASEKEKESDEPHDKKEKEDKRYKQRNSSSRENKKEVSKDKKIEDKYRKKEIEKEERSKDSEKGEKPSSSITKEVEKDQRKIDKKRKSTDSEKSRDEKKEKVDNYESTTKEVKVSIWEKRTVGEVFDAALKRYLERKALKGACT